MREMDSSAGNNHRIMNKLRPSMKEYIRESMNSCEERRITAVYASWLATFGFFVCLISLMLSKPLLQPQGPHSLWLAIIGMFSFTMFLSVVSVMLADGASFTQMQIAVMFIAFFSLLLV